MGYWEGAIGGNTEELLWEGRKKLGCIGSRETCFCMWRFASCNMIGWVCKEEKGIPLGRQRRKKVEELQWNGQGWIWGICLLGLH